MAHQGTNTAWKPWATDSGYVNDFAFLYPLLDVAFPTVSQLAPREAAHCPTKSSLRPAV